MPRPTARDVHREGILANVSIAYRNGAYIAEQVFPIVSVAKRSDFYYIYDKSFWFRDRVAPRSPGVRPERTDYALTSASYFCVNYALGKAVPDEVRDNADTPLQPEIEAAEFITDALMLGMEIRVADIVSTCGNWTSASNPTTKWSVDTSDPLGDLDVAFDAVIQQIGRPPNVGVMSWQVWRELKNHPDILDRVKHTRPGGTPMVSDIADWTGLDRVLVGTSMKETAKEGATSSRSYVWGNMFWMGFVTPNAALMSPTAGYTFRWGGRTFERHREEQERQDVFDGMEYTDEVVTASDAGAIFSTAV